MSAVANASFSRAASRYRRFAQVQTVMADWLAECAPIQTSGSALEVGAGTGLFTQRIFPWKGHYVATDLSPQMCAEGQQILPEIEWVVMPAERPLPGPWDWIFSASMLQWLSDPVSVMNSWRQVLRPGGKILAGFFVDGSLPELRHVTQGWSPLTWRSSHFWEETIRQSGLNLTRSECVERVFWHNSAIEILRGLHGVGASPIRRYGHREMLSILKRYEAEFRVGTQVRSTWKFYRFEATI